MKFPSQKAVRELDIVYKDPVEGFKAMCERLIELGMVEDKRKKK